MRLLSPLAVLCSLTPRVAHSLSSSLAPVTGFVSTSNSRNVDMYVYVPQGLSTTDAQAIVVAVHSCERSAQYYFENTGYAALADQYGYIVIYPNSSTTSGCWDVSPHQPHVMDCC